MRIGYLYNFKAFPPKGGNHVHALELTQGFIRNGHSVAVVDDETMPGTTNFGNERDDLRLFVQNIDVLYIRIDARPTRDWSVMTECIQMAGGLPVILEINSPANETLAYSWLGNKSPFVEENIIRRVRRFIHAAKKLPGIWLEEKHRRQMARHVSAAICVSGALGQYAEECLGIKDVLVLPNGGPLISNQEILRRKAKRTRQEFTVLYSGSAIYPWQGLNYLSQVIALASKNAPDIKFVLAVNQRTPDLPETNNVIILEHLNREQLLDEICAADVCVSLHPEYPWSKYNFHNSPMKLFEYMACMTPSLASNHGQMREIINDEVDGLLCENNADAILQKILFLKNNPDKAKEIGYNSWLRVQNELNWENNVRKTLTCFEKYATVK